MRRYLNYDHFAELSLTRHIALLSDADTGSGLAVKEAGQNAASLAKSAGAKVRRQGAGVGAACNSLLSDADTGSGLAVKEAGQNAASLLKGAGAKRQLDKVGAGTAAIIGLADQNAADYQEGLTNNIDGDGTSDSAVIGQQAGDLEVEAGEGAGNLVPSSTIAPTGSGSGTTTGGSSSGGSPPPPPPKKGGPKARRQLDKVGGGTAAIISLASPDVAAQQEAATNSIDGTGTNDSAALGQSIAAQEVTAGTSAGNLVPSKVGRRE